MIREANKNDLDEILQLYSTRSLPLKEYKAHNEYLRQKHKSDEKLYNRANVYCGCYKIKTFVEKMAEKCKLDMEKYAEINELSGRFYIFSVQIDLDGKLTEEGVQISPFFYAVLCMIKSEGINVNIMQEDIMDFCKEPKSVQEIMDYFGFKSRTSFRRKYLTPMIEDGSLNMTLPEKASSKNQKYYS